MNIAINNETAAVAREGHLTTVAFVVNGGQDSAMGQRARDLARHLGQYDIQIIYRSPRKIISIFSLFYSLVLMRPAVSYVFDISFSGVLAAGCYRLLFGKRLIIETGDAIADLVRSTGNRGRLGLWLTVLLEKLAFWLADRIVVRGSFHQEWLSQRGIDVDVIQDGVDTERFAREIESKLRNEFAQNGVLTVGLIGSSVWSEKLQMCYGWELVETLRLLKDKPVQGIMIGSGSGIQHLQDCCREYGIEDKIVFAGHVPFAELPKYLSSIDVCLSTQTNDLVGQVRTTGKLPLYLAAGRYILASNVGEAARILDRDMLVPYEGVKDESYPQKLAARIETILARPKLLERAAANVSIARERFDYSLLAGRVGKVIAAQISAKEGKR